MMAQPNGKIISICFILATVIVLLAETTITTIAKSAHTSSHNWHLLTETYGGKVSLLNRLTQHTCQTSLRLLLHIPTKTQEQQMAVLNNHACPTEGSSWKKWFLAHLGATQCNNPDGSITIFRGFSDASTSDIKSAMCFR